MNIYLAHPTEKAAENAAERGEYYSELTMLKLAVIVAESEEAARAELLNETEQAAYKYDDVITIKLVGTSISPFNNPGILHYATGTG